MHRASRELGGKGLPPAAIQLLRACVGFMMCPLEPAASWLSHIGCSCGKGRTQEKAGEDGRGKTGRRGPDKNRREEEMRKRKPKTNAKTLAKLPPPPPKKNGQRINAGPPHPPPLQLGRAASKTASPRARPPPAPATRRPPPQTHPGKLQIHQCRFYCALPAPSVTVGLL